MHEVMEGLVEIVREVPGQLWETVRISSAKSTSRLAGFEWWNNKYYRENPPNDGFQEQTDPYGRHEIPYKRELFHPSPLGRFSLGDSEAVAYFSSDFGTNCCETIPELRQNQTLSSINLLAYLRGQSKLLDGLYGYPISVRIAAGSPILDMHAPLVNSSHSSFNVVRGYQRPIWSNKSSALGIPAYAYRLKPSPRRLRSTDFVVCSTLQCAFPRIS
jgi:hypothetical protein